MSRAPWYLQAAAVLALLVAGFAGGRWYTAAAAADTLEDARRATVLSDSTARAWRDSARALDRITRVDTVRLTRWAARWDTLRLQVSDTVRDTLLVRVVATCDSLASACATARRTLTAQLDASRSAFAALEDARHAERTAWASRATRLETTCKRDKWVWGAAGAAAGWIAREVR